MIEGSGRTGEKNAGSRRTAFYIEALLLTAVFAMVILALVRVFAWSGQRGRDAALLTDAVHLAENGAEAVAASDSLEEVRELLEENGNTEILVRSDDDGLEAVGEDAWSDAETSVLRVHYDDDLSPVPGGAIWMEIQWTRPDAGEGEDTGSGGLVESVITVSRAGEREPVYVLETAVFVD